MVECISDKETFHFRPEIWNPSPNLRPRPAASVDEHFNVSVTEIQKSTKRTKESEKTKIFEKSQKIIFR